MWWTTYSLVSADPIWTPASTQVILIVVVKPTSTAGTTTTATTVIVTPGTFCFLASSCVAHIGIMETSVIQNLININL